MVLSWILMVVVTKRLQALVCQAQPHSDTMMRVQLYLVEVPHMVETAVSRVISILMRMGIQKEVQLMARRRGQWSMVAVVGKFTTNK